MMAGRGSREDRQDTHPLSRTITTVAAIIGIVISANTLLSTCARDRIDRSAAFRSSADSEEKFWADLYSQYLQVIADGSLKSEQKRAKLLAIATLATHPNTDFVEFRPRWFFDKPDLTSARVAQLSEMRRRLHDALADPASSTPQIAQEISYIFGQDSAVRPRDEGRTAAASPSSPPAVTRAAQTATEEAVAQSASNVDTSAVQVSYATQVLATGSPSGWDVDIFWCPGAADKQRYTEALIIARKLAVAAGKPLAPGVELGRVRLRTLPQSQQAAIGPAVMAVNSIVWDDSSGEQAAAAAIGKYAGLRTVHSIGAPTKWYLSAFVCRIDAGSAGSLAKALPAAPTE